MSTIPKALTSINQSDINYWSLVINAKQILSEVDGNIDALIGALLSISYFITLSLQKLVNP
ncbi:MAG: hypothetical protein HRU06_17760 [Oceanospirillaceae bacterium]|nr:hypothetical protein [Oceanospirillaceae bacterium]